MELESRSTPSKASVFLYLLQFQLPHTYWLVKTCRVFGKCPHFLKIAFTQARMIKSNSGVIMWYHFLLSVWQRLKWLITSNVPKSKEQRALSYMRESGTTSLEGKFGSSYLHLKWTSLWSNFISRNLFKGQACVSTYKR